MIPDKSSPCWRELATGRKAIETQALGLQMLLKRLQRRINPSSPERDLLEGAEEVHAFFVKYEKILANEIKSL